MTECCIKIDTKDLKCDCKETENGITISITTDNKEKLESLKSMVKSGKCFCCDDDKDKDCC